MCGSAFSPYFLPIGSFGPRLPRHTRGQDREAHHADTPISRLGTADRSAMYIRLISIMTVAVSVKTFEATRSQLQSPVLYARGLTRGRRKMMQQRVRVQANNTKELGPISLPVSDCQITEELREQIYGRFGVDAVIARKKQWGILVGPTCTRQCKACFGQDEVYAVRSPYPVCSTSSVCSARLDPLTRYNPPDRRGLTRRMCSFQ